MAGPDHHHRLLAQLERVANDLGVIVRYEPISDDELTTTAGGRCQLRGRELILIDSRLPPAARCRLLAEALRGFDLSAVYLLPAVRRLIEENDEVTG